MPERHTCAWKPWSDSGGHNLIYNPTAFSRVLTAISIQQMGHQCDNTKVHGGIRFPARLLRAPCLVLSCDWGVDVIHFFLGEHNRHLKPFDMLSPATAIVWIVAAPSILVAAERWQCIGQTPSQPTRKRSKPCLFRPLGFETVLTTALPSLSQWETPTRGPTTYYCILTKHRSLWFLVCKMKLVRPSHRFVAKITWDKAVD